MEREPQTAQERALLLLRATFLPGGSPTAGQGLVWAIRGAIALGVLVLIASAVDKTLWDWLKLLIVPVVLALGGYLFTRSENRRTQEFADRQRTLDREIADEQRTLDREIADQRRQDDMLQAYLEGMSQLLTDEKRPLHRAQVGDSLSTVARARTLTVLTRLDGSRKGSVVRFLYESGLIANDRLILELSSADLRGADLSEADLRGANLSWADLARADLRKARLREANLREAILLWVNVGGADLREANLIDDVLKEAMLEGVNLRTPEAKLEDADLSGASLEGAKVTDYQLSQASSLEGATMPNGQKYEDWLKSRGSEEDGENTNPQ